MNRDRWLTILALLIGFHAAAADEKKPAVLTITLEPGEKLDIMPKKEVLQIRSADDLAKVVTDEKLRKRIAGKVDFKTYTLLIFAWQGSGQDKIEYRHGGSNPEMVYFTLHPGFTKDLVNHIVIHAVRNDCKWHAK